MGFDFAPEKFALNKKVKLDFADSLMIHGLLEDSFEELDNEWYT